MHKNILFSFFVLVLFFVLNVNLFSQQCELTASNINFESANSLTFDVFIKNTGTSSLVYSHGSLAWTFDTAILNGGTPTFSLVPGFSDFAASAYPPSALITSPNILRTSSNLPGSNGVIQAGQSLRLYRFRLQTSAASFNSENFSITWKNLTVPYTRIFTWDTGSGLPIEIENLEFSVLALLLEENFDYPAGDTLTHHGWIAHSGAGTQPITVNNGGLTYSGYAGSGIGNAALVDNNGEDINKVFSAQTSGTVYASFMVRVDNYVTSTPSYFFHFGQDDPMNALTYRGKIFAQKSGTADLQFGLSFASNTPTLTAVNYSIGITYLVVLKYQIVSGVTNDSVSIFIFSGSIPASEPSVPTIGSLTETTGDLANVDAVALRQFNASENVVVDGIRVATSWTELFPPAGTPLLNVTPSTLSGFSYLVGAGPSASQSYNLSGSNLTPASGSITVTGSTNYEVSLNNTTFSGSVSVGYSGGTLAATPIYVRLKAGLPGGTYNGELIANSGGGATTQNVTCNGFVIKSEPTNHVTGFTGVLGTPSYYYIILNWIDASGGTTPDGYLIKGSSFNFDSIKVPIDGVPETNSLFVQNVAQGIQTKSFGLNSATTYYFKVYPYTNSGSTINYKTDGSVPQFSIATNNAPSLPIIENFEYATGSNLTSNGWIAHSGAGINPILVNDTPLSYTGYINSGLGKSVTITNTGEDVNRAFDSVKTGSIYASFMVNISSAQTGGDYFFHLGLENTTILYYARFFAKKNASDSLAFGISKLTNSPSYTPFNYAMNTTYLVVMKYTFNDGPANDEVKLWINPILNGIEPVADIIHTESSVDVTSLGMFALRQGNNATQASYTFGGLRVANTWVPEAGATTFPLSVNITNGWNMVSIPGLHPVDQNVSTWWPGLTGTVWGFNGVQYVGKTIATPGEGYWMKHVGATVYNYPAIQIVAHTPLNAISGWNMIGGYENSVATIGLVTSPPNQITGTIWGFNGVQYVAANTLVPGYSYWVKLLPGCPCTITIPEALVKGTEAVEYFKAEWGRIILTDASGLSYTLYAVKGEVDLDQYEMPPMPPAGMFDIRFSSGRIAEDINSSIQTIDMSGIEYPLTVRVENIDIRLQDVTGKQINLNLKSGEDIVISDATINKLMVSGELIPDKYALEQNYPNPFNPSTVIEFSLPENVGNVRLSIYNALGEKVAELVNTALTAGKYQYQWNAKNVATGMYIYELRTDKFVSVKKMILMK